MRGAAAGLAGSGYHYVWLAWAMAFLLPWAGLFVAVPGSRREMLWASVLTLPLGLTEPLFVPQYWNPPSLFDLAQRTGFDLESLIFTFAISGVGAVLYNATTGRMPAPVADPERRQRRHRFHRWALAAPFLAFLMLHLLPWNPIYAGIAAMGIGALATVACRPDLKFNTLVGGVLFLAFYALFMLALKWSAPGYIEAVWNLGALTGVRPGGIPLEELLFGLTFGMYWSGAYEHLTWHRSLHRTPAKLRRRGASAG